MVCINCEFSLFTFDFDFKKIVIIELIKLSVPDKTGIIADIKSNTLIFYSPLPEAFLLATK